MPLVPRVVAVLLRVGFVATWARASAASLDASAPDSQLRGFFRLPRRCLEAGVMGAVLSGVLAAALGPTLSLRQGAGSLALCLLAAAAHAIALPTLLLGRRRRTFGAYMGEAGLGLGAKVALACAAPTLAAGWVGACGSPGRLGATLLAAGVVGGLAALLYAGLMTGPVGAAGALARAVTRIGGGDHEADPGRHLSDDELGRAALGLREALGSLARHVADTRESVEKLDRRGAELQSVTGSTLQITRSEGEHLVHMGRALDELGRLGREVDGASDRVMSELRRVADLLGRVGFGTSESALEAEALARAAENASEGTAQMEQTIARVANRSQGLSQAAADTAASTAAMDDAVARVRLAAEDTASLSARVAQEAERGYRAVHKTLDEIERIRNLVEVARETIEDLGSRVGGIGQVVLVIEEIAQKSNLLALNASIIAAQAGEHGRGFQVVASGIKALASRTAASTKEIAAQIAGIQSESLRARETMASGVEAVTQGFHVAVGAGDALGEIRQSARSAQKKVHGIARAMEEQAGASRRVADATNQVASMSRELADAVRAHLSGGERVRETAQQMLEVAGRVERRLREQLQGTSHDTALAELQSAAVALQRAQKEELRGMQRLAAQAAQVREQERAVAQQIDDVARVVTALREDAARLRRRLDGA